MRKLTTWEKIGYGAGDIANSITYTATAMFLLVFYTDVLQIPAYQAGILFLVARIYDAVADVLMGIYIDKRKQKNSAGKFRPFILKGCWPILFMAVLVFTAPNFGDTGKIVWAYITYLAWGMAYTFVNIPYGSLAAAMTNDLRDRASLSITRSIGSKTGAIIPQILVLPILSLFANEKYGWITVTTLMAVISYMCYVFCYKNTTEQIKHGKPEDEKIDTKIVIKSIIYNRPFLGVAFASVATVTTWMINGTMAIYYFKYNLDAQNWYWLKGILSVLPTFVLAPIVGFLVYKYGNRNLAIFGSLIASIFFTTIMVLPDSIYIYLTLFFLGFIFFTIPDTLLWMMVADSVDYGEWITDSRAEGIIYAAYSFMRKVAQALAGLVAGFGLTIIGYDSNLTTQSDATMFGIKFLTNGVPAIGMLIAFLIFIFVYNLTPAKRKQMITDLIAKRPE
ncbi:glycoside-pentoside-hexuronide (GPH):cation symporter [Pseudofrancisella aestuarii]|uniref:Glycoside-pentoside-hexuronide (GPH):cation symporter n=1 Tax=Pseudofrancisella aestuarii TaxID=2670347 RepID=A0ABV9TCX8_9GAMM|nr:glycoside-pentoside-hexuronide (GPH):cation symporter [Pseudofrancisella aestuarii]